MVMSSHDFSLTPEYKPPRKPSLVDWFIVLFYLLFIWVIFN